MSFAPSAAAAAAAPGHARSHSNGGVKTSSNGHGSSLARASTINGAAAGRPRQNKGRDWLVGKLDALHYAQKQYVLTAGLILRHHVDARQLGLPPHSIRAPKPLLDELEHSREEYTWVRAEIEQYARRMRVEVGSESPEPTPAALPPVDPNSSAASLASRTPPPPRTLQPPVLAKTIPHSGAPTYLKQPTQQHPSPLRNPTTITDATNPALSTASANGNGNGSSATTPRHTPQPSLSISVQRPPPSASQPQPPRSPAQANNRSNMPPPQSSPSGRPLASTSSANSSPKAPAKPQGLALPPASGSQSSTTSTTPTQNAAPPPQQTSTRPKPKPRFATAPQPQLDAAAPSLSEDTPAPPVAAPVNPPNPAPAPFKLTMPKPSDFLPGGKSGPPPAQPVDLVSQLVQQQPQQSGLGSLTAADVENMTSEEAQRILDSFGSNDSSSNFNVAIPPFESSYPPPTSSAQADVQAAFDPSAFADLDLSMMTDLLASAGGEGGELDLSALGAEDVDWDAMMQSLAGATEGMGGQ